MQIQHKLLVNNYPKRLEFCSLAKNKISNDPNFLNRILFTDLIHWEFYKQLIPSHTQYYDDSNPHLVIQIDR